MRVGGPDRLRGAFGRRFVILADMVGEGLAGAVEAAGLDRRPDFRQAGLGRVVGDRGGPRHRIDGNAADAVDATQLSFNPGRPKDGEEITDFKRPGGH